MGAREDQIKRLFIITKFRDELVYWCKINGKKLFYVGKRSAKLTDKTILWGQGGPNFKRFSITKLRDGWMDERVLGHFFALSRQNWAGDHIKR